MAEQRRHDWRVSGAMSHQEAQDWLNGNTDDKIPADVSAIQGSLVDKYTKFLVFKDAARTGTDPFELKPTDSPVDFDLLTNAMNSGNVGTLGYNRDEKAYWLVYQQKDKAKIENEFPGLLAD